MFKLLAATLASAALASHHETLTFTPSEFKHLGYADKSELVRFSVALPWQNFEVLESRLNKISDPKDASYGHWMSQEEVNELTGASEDKRSAAAAYLKENNAMCTNTPHSLRCVARVADVDNMFQTRVSAFNHTKKANARVLRVHPNDSYRFPDALQGSVEFITNLLDFPTVRRRGGVTKAFNHKSLGAADYIVTVESLDSFYGSATGSNSSIQSPAEFQDDASWSPADLKKFATENGLSVWEVNKKVGPYQPANPDLEASLDEQFMGAVGQGNNNWYWTEVDWMYEWTEAIAAASNADLPNVFSVSWGWYELDQCTIDPSSAPCKAGGTAGSAAYVTTTNKGFAAAGARGISILVSSGDSGAHGRTDGSCSSPKTRPDWPTACPYITAVGATQIKNGVDIPTPTTPICKSPPAGLTKCAGSGSEIVCSTATGALIVSGGGFSTLAPMPAWQTSAVQGFLSAGGILPPAGDFNSSNRAYPDVAALGHNYIIYASGQPVQVDGTSCSAPVFGAVIALANAARIKTGKAVLGFLNPAIYQLAVSTPAIFTDVTVGDNKCTENGCSPGCTGYGAVKGYDAVTGFGTPNIPAMITALTAL